MKRLALNHTVSIIIPIYNEEKTLQRCVDSVIAQTYKNLEIILVDDGSSDGSAHICDAYASKDKRIKVVHQENMGLSAARNTGLDIASSSFIQFADSDDYLLPTMTEELMAAILEENASAAQCSFFSLNDTSSFSYPAEDVPEKKRITYYGNDIVSLIVKNHVSTVVQWNKIFRREIFENLRYPIGKYHEDEYVIHRQLVTMNSLTRINQRLYCYVRHPGSITYRKTAEKAIHSCEAYLDRIVFLASRNYLDVAGVTYVKLLKMLALNREFLENEPDKQDALLEIDRIQAETNRIANKCFPWNKLHDINTDL